MEIVSVRVNGNVHVVECDDEAAATETVNAYIHAYRKSGFKYAEFHVRRYTAEPVEAVLITFDQNGTRHESPDA